MARLHNSKVVRAGVTARYWAHGTSIVQIKGQKQQLNIDFSIDSKGGGTTQIQTQIKSDDFEDVLRQMMESDKAKALRAMTAIIAEYHS